MRILAAALLLLQLPSQLVTLDNGLQVVMQPDASMPNVGVEFWIRGGSREEVPGLHGIAHLFEHNLPSSGRFYGNAENRALAGRTNRGSGAGTQPDYLRFYLYTTPEGVEAALGALADRLESDPEKFTAENVKRDQDIVVSELRRVSTIDWDMDVQNLLARGTFGADHPYGHATSGNESDVRNATVETMRDWHRRFAGASNAIVFVVGNFDPAKVEPMVRKHFGSIAPGTRAPRTAEAIPATQGRRDVIEKDVPRPLVYLRWPTPGWGSVDGDHLTLLANVLDGAKVELLEMAGAFQLRGEDEKAMRASLDRVLRDGITEPELTRAKSAQQLEFVKMLERGVWRGSRADALGFDLMFRGNADAYREQLARIANATVADVNAAARRWLATPGYVLEVVPQPRRAAAAPYDRSLTVPPGENVPVTFPAIEQKTLPNGLRVLLIPRGSLPLAQITVGFSDGSSASKTVLSANIEEELRAIKRGEMNEPSVRERALSCALGDCGEAAPQEPSAEVLIVSGDVRAIPNAASELPRRKTAHEKAKPIKSPTRERFVVVDQPSANQTFVTLAQVLPPGTSKDSLDAELVVMALRTRLMNNLRSAKGWSYEVYPFGVESRRGGAIARFNIPLHPDKTAEAITEIRKEIARLRDEPVTPENLNTFRAYLEGNLTSGLMSLANLNEQALQIARNDRALDSPAKALARLRAYTPEQLQAAAKTLLQPDQLLWIVAGKREEVERELKELGVPFELHEAR